MESIYQKMATDPDLFPMCKDEHATRMDFAIFQFRGADSSNSVEDEPPTTNTVLRQILSAYMFKVSNEAFHSLQQLNRR